MKGEDHHHHDTYEGKVWGDGDGLYGHGAAFVNIIHT